MYDARRKYWGGFCPLAQNAAPYVHTIYPGASGIIRDQGVLREFTPEELDADTERSLDLLNSSAPQ